MNNITINVTIQRRPSEIEQLQAAAQGLAIVINRAINNKIVFEQKRGNPLFANIETHAQYLAALEADDCRRRKELGFWRYHFGSVHK